MKSPAPRRDRHAFYEAAVQGVEWDLDFLVRAFRTRNDRAPRTFREDFCSTAALATAWAQRHPDNRSWAVDLDPEPLAWAKRHRLPYARGVEGRVHLVRSDVRRPQRPAVDVACALNFSWWVFHRRTDLVAYLRAARASLVSRGLLVMNLYGGTRAEKPLVERTRKAAGNGPDGTMHEGFTYIWEQESFDAVTRRLLAHIHFESRAGRRMARAFTYDWRMWTLPELRECALEAGFREVEVWSEGWTRDRRTHNGVLYQRRTLDNDDCWIAYAALVR